MAVTESDIFDLQIDIAQAIAKETDAGKKQELEDQLEFYEIERANIISADNAQLIAMLQPKIARLEEIIKELSDPALLLGVKRFRIRTGIPAAPSTPSSPPPPPAAATVEAASVASSIDPENKDRDLDKLHPEVRRKVKAVQKQLDKEGIPMKVFEAYREPERQAHLYAKGRTTGGSKVTNAKPWQSYHQYGLAADFVRFENNRWNWNTNTAEERKQWARFHDIARENGLEPLTWEMPHVQLIGTSFAELMNGAYPAGGDESWSANLSSAISRWPHSPKPPLPAGQEKPTMPTPALLAGAPAMLSAGWHNKFGGDHWRFDGNGVYTRSHDGSEKLWRTAGAPLTAQEILARYSSAIMAASTRHGVPPALIVMTIATEAGRYRKDGFTGPETFRWEKGVILTTTGDSNIDGKEKGDYSAGPMQVLSNTARWMNNVHSLGHNNATDLRWFKNEPAKHPAKLGLYDGGICIDVGTAYIAHNAVHTGFDPILVAAAYNAGSLRPSSENHWRIHCHRNHLDRAAEWYGDACAVLNGTG